jgi:predicted DNA-binding protein (UPF0251 family)
MTDPRLTIEEEAAVRLAFTAAELEAWELVVDQNMTHQAAADRLGIKRQSVSDRMEAARARQERTLRLLRSGRLQNFG